jgi:hypothetical protein
MELEASTGKPLYIQRHLKISTYVSPIGLPPFWKLLATEDGHAYFMKVRRRGGETPCVCVMLCDAV